jgi:hypothetical protein
MIRVRRRRRNERDACQPDRRDGFALYLVSYSDHGFTRQGYDLGKERLLVTLRAVLSAHDFNTIAIS